MSGLAALVALRPLKKGDHGNDVLALQTSLSAAGYRVGEDGDFGDRTDYVVRQFQNQHGLHGDGIVGPRTAALLDSPHETLVLKATPLVHASGWPHDDTASLMDFYGRPWENSTLITAVKCPWDLFYEGKLWPHPIQLHVKCSQAFAAAFDEIWTAAGKSNDSTILKHVKNFSGSGNYRPIRGSSRLSTHAFWAAIDFDAEHLPMNKHISRTEMPQEVVDAFEKVGLFWGGRFIGRPDSMHWQASHE